MPVFVVVALPVIGPVLVLGPERTSARRWRIAPFVVPVPVAVTAGSLFVTMLRTHPTVHLGEHHLAYALGLRYGIPVVGLYLVATCGSMLASGFRHVFWFGVSNLVAIAVLARLSADGFTSLWCYCAALSSGAIALWLRLGHPADPTLPAPADRALA